MITSEVAHGEVAIITGLLYDWLETVLTKQKIKMRENKLVL